MEPDDVACGLYTAAAVAAGITSLAVALATGGDAGYLGVAGYTEARLAAMLYVQVAFTLAVSAIPLRTSAFALEQTTTRMDTRKAFVRYISHEIRTPLNTVFLGMTLVKSSLANIDVKDALLDETVEDITCSCQTALSILNDLLTFDKIDAGRMTLDLEASNPLQYFLSTAKPFAVQARQKCIGFKVDFVEDPEDENWVERYSLLIDQHKMGQVVRNLISNGKGFGP